MHELRALQRCALEDAPKRSQHADEGAAAHVLRLARDSVARYAKKHEPDALQRIQRVWNRDKMQRTTIAGKQAWTPAADDTAEALGLKGHTLGRIPEDCVGEEDVPGDLDVDVTRAVVTNRVTSDAYAAEHVAHAHARA